MRFFIPQKSEKESCKRFSLIIAFSFSEKLLSSSELCQIIGLPPLLPPTPYPPILPTLFSLTHVDSINFMRTHTVTHREHRRHHQLQPGHSAGAANCRESARSFVSLVSLSACLTDSSLSLSHFTFSSLLSFSLPSLSPPALTPDLRTRKSICPLSSSLLSRFFKCIKSTQRITGTLSLSLSLFVLSLSLFISLFPSLSLLSLSFSL